MGAAKTKAEKSGMPSPARAQASTQPFVRAAEREAFFPPVQAKMSVSRPGDRFEQEADRTADKVMRTELGEARLQRRPDDQLQKREDPNKLQRTADEGLQRAGEGSAPAVSGNVQAAIQRQAQGGQPLAADVRGFMEPRFQADFSGVRVHQDAAAASLSNQLSARAFTYQNHVFFSRDQYQPGTSEGRHLLAHELTHTIQQGHSLPRSPQISAASATPTVQRLGVDDALDRFAEWAYDIPGFRLFTLVIGFNPVNMRAADRTSANILRGLIELMPGGALISQSLDNHGIINKAATWVEAKLGDLGDLGAGLNEAIKAFLESLSWRDIFDLEGVWQRAKRILGQPVGRLTDFAISTAGELLILVRDAILRPLAAMAQGTRGYDLLCVLLGEDPISHEPKPPTAENLLGGFMKLIGQEEIWENIKRGNAVERAYKWFRNALGGLMGLVRAVPQRIVDTLQSLSFEDVITVVKAFGKVVGAFVSVASDFMGWGLSTIWELLKIIFDVVKPGLMGYVQRTGAALQSILKNPMPFLGNLVRAAKQGFSNFAGRFGEHLKTGIIEWLTGSLQGVYIPRAATLPELGKFAMSVLGITWAQIRTKIVTAIGPNGERIMQGLEVAFDVVKALVTGGIAAVWELIKEKLTDLKDQVIDGIIGFVTDTIVKRAIPKLIAMFIPGAGFIPAIISIYDTIMVFVEKISKIIQVVTAFIDSIVSIAAGNITAAASRVERILAGLLGLAINFLAGFLGLGRVTDKIMEVVQKVRAKVDATIGAAVTWVVNKAKSLFARLFSRDAADDRSEEQKERDKTAALNEASAQVPRQNFKESEMHAKLVPIKSRYRLRTLNLVIDSQNAGTGEERIHFVAAASPETSSAGIVVQADAEPVGPLGITRSMLSWKQETLDHFLRDPIWNKYKGPAGEYLEASIDIRHKVSISDTITNTDNVLKPKKVPEAADVLTAKKVGQETFVPHERSRPGIVTAARRYLQAANNDISNLFLGDARENRSLGRRYDAGSGEDAATQMQDFVTRWGLSDEAFTITIERNSRRRNTTYRTASVFRSAPREG